MTAKDKTTLKSDSDTVFPSGTGNIQAVNHRGFNNDVIDSYINTEETATQTLSGDIDFDNNEIVNEPNLVAAKRSIYTGWHVAPSISVNAGDNKQFDLGSGVGYFADLSDPSNPAPTIFVYAGATGIAGTLLSATRQTFVTINSSGTVIQRNEPPTAKQGEQELFVGNLTHGDDVGTNDIFVSAQKTPLTDYSLVSTVRQFLRSLRGINLQGLEYSGVAATLNIQYSAGTGLTFGRNYDADVELPDTPEAVGASAPTIVQKYENLSNVLVTFPAPPTASVNVNQYRNPATGALVAMTNNNWQIKRIYFFYGSNTTIMYYGNAQYTNKENALAAISTESFTEHPDTYEAVFRGWLVVQEGATDLTNLAQAEFRTAGGIRGVGGAGGSPVAIDLQDAYDNGNIITTNVPFGPVEIRRGSGADTDPILRGFNGLPVPTFTVTGNGDVTANSYAGAAGAVGAGLTGVVKQVQNNGVGLTSRQRINFLNATSIVDNAGNNSTDITLPSGGGGLPTLTQYYNQTRSSTQTLNVSAPTTIIPNVAIDTARGTDFNTTTGVLTVGSGNAGIWYFKFSCDVLVNGTNTPPVLEVRLIKNGSNVVVKRFPYSDGSAVGSFEVSIDHPLELAVADTARIDIFNETGQIASVQNQGMAYHVRLGAL